MEMISLVFKFCVWIEKKSIIDMVDKNLINHTNNCRTCAEKLIMNNTFYTCKEHIVPRLAIGIFDEDNI